VFHIDIDTRTACGVRCIDAWGRPAVVEKTRVNSIASTVTLQPRGENRDREEIEALASKIVGEYKAQAVCCRLFHNHSAANQPGSRWRNERSPPR
jgi:hypothetical protein